MTTVFDVAKYVLDEYGDMTTMKLQKLVYYCQAWSLVWDEIPLFNEDFQAWANGPVCRELFDKHKGHFNIGKGFFDNYAKNTSEFNKDNIETMDAVIRDYADETPIILSDLTHSERPWIEARGNCKPGASCENIISKELMQEYYAGLYNQN